jgi:hypothetical protein
LYIAGMTLVTWVAGDPLYLPFWTVIIPAIILPICLMARVWIRNSEGALGGERLANWALGITGFICLGYWSYHAATLIALRQQASSFVSTQFIPPLIKGKIEEAYIYTYREPRPVVNAGLRKFIEENLNAPPSLKMPGKFTLFSESEYVRLLQLAGGAAKVELKSIGSPILEKQAMQVPLVYDVKTPLKDFELQVMVTGGHIKEMSGRRWQIDIERTGLIAQSGVLTEPEGMAILGKLEPVARQFALTWVSKLTTVIDADGAYRCTLPLALHEKIMAKVTAKGEDDLNKQAETDAELKQYLDGVKEFRAGGVVKNLDKFFANSEATRSEVTKEVKKRFTSGFATMNWLKLSNGVPLFENDGKNVRFTYDLNIQLLPAYVGQAQLIVEADASVLKDPSVCMPKDWHVVRLDMVRGNAAPKIDPRQQRQELE